MSREPTLSERVAIITGATSGIGLAAARRFADEGAHVILASTEDDAGEVIATELADRDAVASFAHCDVSNPKDVERLVNQTQDEFGRVDVLYSNAGVMATGTAPGTALETWDEVIKVNLSGQFYLAKFGIPALIQGGGGSIILTASELGLTGAKSTVAYCAAKGAMINMTRALAVDCGEHNIRVNCLAPGPIDTPMLRRWIEAADDPEALATAQRAPILLGRFGAPEEVAAAALFLASDESSFMTGAVLVVDGGITVWYGM